MPPLRIASYNIAWFAQLFDQRNQLVADQEWSAIRGVTRRRQAEAIAEVLRRVDADCYSVVEAPNSGHRQSCVAELEGFAAHFGLRQRAGLIGFENPTDQEIALLFDPDRLTAEHAPIGEVLGEAAARTGRLPFGAPRFDSVFPADLDGDGEITLHRFSKPPLEAVVEDRATGRTLRLIAVHLKSKVPHSPGSPVRQRRRAVEDRVKQHTQAMWLRARLEEHMAAGEPVIALGDFNDGPGFDHLEELAGRSSVELIMGDPAAPETRMVNPFTDLSDGPAPSTARFVNNHTGAPIEALIDFIVLSPDLAAAARPRWRIWHPNNDPGIVADTALRSSLLDASDHFPVSVDLDFG
ncbi:MAG TPA: endonuclease/exonuclease/phosphatase family protein [Thermohalobaculum sp.]|nr:endonuclease/exonuclease/phosphatase family protein [Thermohalobaculum sp.]